MIEYYNKHSNKIPEINFSKLKIHENNIYMNNSRYITQIYFNELC